MGYIYKITNTINQKVYIGKTERTIEQRFKEHCEEAFRERGETRPLYRAMRKYGIEAFSIELLEETLNTDIREQYWIDFYQSYYCGYNATLGGEGKTLYNYEAIANRLYELPYPALVAKEFNCHRDTVSYIAKKFNIEVKNCSYLSGHRNTNEVYQYLGQELINIFPSVHEAAKWCYENKKCKTLNSGVRSHICDCANGKRKTAYGFIWSYCNK